MEYTIQKIASISGVSTRTLRYYDTIGLLRPARLSEAGYRIYGKEQLDRLQQILFYREMGMELKNIAAILDAPGFDRLAALRGHLTVLEERRERMALIIQTIKKTIMEQEGQCTMTAEEKFEGLKRQMLSDNEKAYGQEIRSRYGADTVEQSNRHFAEMSEADFHQMQALGNELNALLEHAVTKGASPEGPQGQKAFSLHKRWLDYTWPSYTRQAHLGLVQLYVADERFTMYYDKNVPGCAAFLRDAVTFACSGKLE